MRILKEPEERKAEILDTAEILFNSKGYDKTTVNDILNEIGIAKGTFYYYFKSKEEVMDAIIMRIIDRGVKAAEVIAEDSKLTVQEKMLQILMSQGPESGKKEQVLEQLHQAENARMHQKSLVQTILKLTPILAKVIEQGIEEGLFFTPYPKESIECLLVSSEFLFDEGLFHWEPEELMRKVNSFICMTERTLGAKEGSLSYIMTLFQNNAEDSKEKNS